MKLVLVAAALSAVSYAQIDMAKITDCSALFDECRTGADANQATCVAAKAQCDQCQTDYNQCRAPGNGVSLILSNPTVHELEPVGVNTSFPLYRSPVTRLAALPRWPTASDPRSPR